MDHGHPVAYDAVLAFAWGETTGAVAERITDHLGGCAACQATVDRVRLVRETLAAEASPLPMPSVMDRAKAIFPVRPHPAGATRLPSACEAMKRVAAALAFDSRRGFGLAGLRAGPGDQGNHYQMVFEHPRASIDLDIATGPAEATVMGQVSLVDGDDLPLEVVIFGDDEAEVARTMTDEGGMFTVTLAPAQYSVDVALPGGEEWVLASPVVIDPWTREA